MLSARKGIESIETTLDLDNQKVLVDSKNALNGLKLAESKLEVAQVRLENLDQSKIAEQRRPNYKAAVFESYGQSTRPGLPELFERYQNKPVVGIIRSVREEIQEEI